MSLLKRIQKVVSKLLVCFADSVNKVQYEVSDESYKFVNFLYGTSSLEWF